MRQLLAQRGAEALGNARRDQGHGGPGQCQRDRGIRCGCGEAGGAGQRGPATRLRSPRMKTTAPERVDLPVSGMTCAACARSIERTLANTPGVERANVNLATNTATVEFDPGIVRVRDFVGAIEELGYGVPEKAAPSDAAEQGYRRRLLVAAIFAAPVLVLGMSHGMLHVPYSPWIQLALTLPVILYCGRAVLHGGVERAASRRGQHELADRAGHRRRLPLFAGGDGARTARRLLRGRRRNHRADSARPDAGGAGARAGQRGHPQADGSATARGARTPRRRGSGDGRGGSARRRHRGGASGRAHSGGWRGDGG